MIQTSARLLQLLGLFPAGRAWTAPALAVADPGMTVTTTGRRTTK